MKIDVAWRMVFIDCTNGRWMVATHFTGINRLVLGDPERQIIHQSLLTSFPFHAMASRSHQLPVKCMQDVHPEGVRAPRSS